MRRNVHIACAVLCTICLNVYALQFVYLSGKFTMFGPKTLKYFMKWSDAVERSSCPENIRKGEREIVGGHKTIDLVWCLLHRRHVTVQNERTPNGHLFDVKSVFRLARDEGASAEHVLQCTGINVLALQ